MPASWDVFLGAVGEQDWEVAVTTLCEELSYQDPLELLPLLRGMLGEVLKREDQTRIESRARREKKGTAFGRFGHTTSPVPRTVAAAGAEADEPLAGGAGARRWRRALRVMFNVEAAIALQDELLARYRSEDFALSCRELYERLGTKRPFQENVAEIDALCLREAMGPVLQRYGFLPDESGSQELKAIMADFGSTHKEVFEKNLQIQGLVLGHFPSGAANKTVKSLPKTAPPGKEPKVAAPEPGPGDRLLASPLKGDPDQHAPSTSASRTQSAPHTPPKSPSRGALVQDSPSGSTQSPVKPGVAEYVLTAGPAGLVPRGVAPAPVCVKKVNPGSWAESRGLSADDEILELNGTRVADLGNEAFHAEMHVRPLRILIRHQKS